MTTQADVQGWAGGLDAVLERIAPRFARAEPRRRAAAHLRGLPAPAGRGNGWQLAEAAGDATPDGAMAAGAGRGLRRDLGGAGLHLVDATALPLDGRSRTWARFPARACGARAHVVHDAGAEVPVFAAVGAATLNDVAAAHAMPRTPGATHVFDLGHHDHAWWAKLDAAGRRLVTRLKRNTRLHAVEDRGVPEGGGVPSDRTGRLPARRARDRRDPMDARVREVRASTDAGTLSRSLTDDAAASASRIAALCKRRWAIELFFRWVGQAPRTRHFLGASENAARAQLATALTACPPLRAAQAARTVAVPLLLFARLTRADPMHRRPLDTLLPPRATGPVKPAHPRPCYGLSICL